MHVASQHLLIYFLGGHLGTEEEAINTTLTHQHLRVNVVSVLANTCIDPVEQHQHLFEVMFLTNSLVYIRYSLFFQLFFAHHLLLDIISVSCDNLHLQLEFMLMRVFGQNQSYVMNRKSSYRKGIFHNFEVKHNSSGKLQHSNHKPPKMTCYIFSFHYLSHQPMALWLVNIQYKNID